MFIIFHFLTSSVIFFLHNNFFSLREEHIFICVILQIFHLNVIEFYKTCKTLLILHVSCGKIQYFDNKTRKKVRILLFYGKIIANICNQLQKHHIFQALATRKLQSNCECMQSVARVMLIYDELIVNLHSQSKWKVVSFGNKA